MAEPLNIDNELKRIAGVLQRLIDRQEKDETEDPRAKSALGSIREESPEPAEGEVALDEVGGEGRFDPLRAVIDKDLANRLVADVFREARKDSRLDRVGDDALYIHIVGNLLTSNFDPRTNPDIASGNLAPIDQALVSLIQGANDRAIAFPRRPTSNLQIRPILDALRNEGVLTDQRWGLLTKQPGFLSPDAETDQLIEDSLDALRDAAPGIILRMASGITDPRDRGGIVRHAEALIASERKQGVRPGESVFPLLMGDTPQLLQAEADATRFLPGNKIAAGVKELLAFAKISTLKDAYPDANEYAAVKAAEATLIERLTTKQQQLRGRGFSDDEVAYVVQLEAQEFIGDGESIETSEFLALKADALEVHEAVRVSTSTGAEKALKEFAFQKGLDLDSISDAHKRDLERRIGASGSAEAVGDQILRDFPAMQRLKINEDIGESQATLEQTVRDAGFPEDRVPGAAQQLGRQLAIDPLLDVGQFLHGPAVDAEGRPIPSYRRGGLLGGSRPAITPGPVFRDPDITGFERDTLGIPDVRPRRATSPSRSATQDAFVDFPGAASEPRLSEISGLARLDAQTELDRPGIPGDLQFAFPDERDDGLPVEDVTTRRLLANQDILDFGRARQLAGETPLTSEQEIELGLPVGSGLTVEDINRRFGVTPPGGPPFVGSAGGRGFKDTPDFPGVASEPRLAEISGLARLDPETELDRPGIPADLQFAFPAFRVTPLEAEKAFPDFRVAAPPSRLIDFGFPDTEAGEQAFSDRLSNMAFLAAEGDTDLQRYFIDEIPKLIPQFQEAGIAGFKEKERRARETATSLQKAGKFSPGQTAAFIGDVGRRREKLDFVPFAEGRLPGLKSKFLETPFAVERAQQRAEDAAEEAKRLDAEQEQNKRRRLRRRGRTRITRAV